MKILYLAEIDSEVFPGVLKKVNQTVDAFKLKGNEVDEIIIHPDERSKYLFKIYHLALIDKYDYLILRFNVFFPFWILLVILLRIKGTKVVIDIPTPLSITLNEISAKGGGVLKKIWFYLFFPWSLIFSSRIIQYAPESRYFSCGIGGKFFFSANGVIVDDIEMKKNFDKKSGDLNFVGVASLAYWHAYDRLIKSIALHKKIKPNSNPIFYIVGDGEERKNLEEIVKINKIEENVIFTGFLSGFKLDEIFEKSNIAVSSLGLFRKNLNIASDLKTREYLARGLPCIKSGEDPDLKDGIDFVFEVSNDEELIDLYEIYDWFEKLRYDKSKAIEIRNFCKENMDFSKKIDELINF